MMRFVVGDQLSDVVHKRIEFLGALRLSTTVDRNKVGAGERRKIHSPAEASGKKPPDDLLFAKIKKNGQIAFPFLQQAALVGERSPQGGVPINRHAALPSFQELGTISLSSSPIQYPHQFRVEGFARSTLLGLYVRMLKLEYPTTIGLNIRDMSLAIGGAVNDFLPVKGKLTFPGAVPLSFVLPPRVAMLPSLVSPVPNPELSALRNNRAGAARAPTLLAGLRLLALSIDQCKSHWIIHFATFIRSLRRAVAHPVSQCGLTRLSGRAQRR